MLKKIITKKGRTMYYRDGRLVSENDLTSEERGLREEPKIEGITEELKDDPQFTVRSIDSLDEIDKEVEELERIAEEPIENTSPITSETSPIASETSPSSSNTVSNTVVQSGCLFCGAPREKRRGVFYKGSMLEVPMCGSCYLEKTLGEIMQKLNQKGE